MSNQSSTANSNYLASSSNAEEALRQSDDRYRALVEATGQAVWSWAPAGGRNDFERSKLWWQELTGQSLDEQLGEHAWLEVVHPDDRLESTNAWSRALSTRTKFDLHFRVHARDGGWKYVRSRGCPIIAEDGTVREWVGTFDDVSLQYAATAEREQLLAEATAERLRVEDVFRHAPTSIAVLRGPNHVFERVNDRYFKLIGGRNVVGLPVRNALPELAGQVYFELLDQVYQTGTAHTSVDSPIIFRGPQNQVERTVEFVYQPLLDAAGRVSGVIVQGIDLTEKRETEADLARVIAESEKLRRMYETALFNTADFIYLFDTSGRFTFVNQALLRLWQKELSEAVGKNFFELDYPPELAGRLQSQIQEVIDTRRPLRADTTYTSHLGTESYEYIFVPVFGPDGTVEAVAGSTRQISARKRSEEALRVSEERHRALVTATSDVVYRMSADWQWMQPLDGRGLVATNNEPVIDWMQKNIPPFEHARVSKAISIAIETKHTFELEHQVIRSDGTLGWTFSRAVPILDASGEITEWFGTASDVTRRKEAEAALNDIRSRMEVALAAGAIGTWSWDVQADQFYGDASLARIFAVDQADVAGGKLSRILSAVHPEDRDRVIAKIARTLKSENRYEANYRVAQPDGTWKSVTARGQIERDMQGQALRFPGVVIDVTDWKRAEDDLARLTEDSKRRKRIYETILSNTPDFAYVIGLDHRFIYCNDPLLKMWGRTWDQAVGKTFAEIGYEAWHAEMHEREVDHVKATRQPIRGEIPFNGTLGRRIYDYIFVPVLGANGEVEAVAGTTRDVTDRKASEEALRDADRKKDDFLALLAHELRNPLAPIRNGLQVMRLAEGDREVIARAREMMDRQLSHMVRLIDDLLDISRITRNKMELRRGRIALAEVVNSAVEAAGHLIETSGHELTITLPTEPVILDADLTRLAQVFSNLITNSAKYTPPGGKIFVSAMRVENESVISVRDTGLGIPQDALPNIFDMFSQVDRSVERSTGGLGIGLALVKGLVEMHGGTVKAESVEGQGSTFTVRLPVAESEFQSISTLPLSVSRNSPGKRVLVVDDSRDGAASMAMMLRLLGNTVAMAHDGLEAIRQAEVFQPDVILMDIGLPNLSGLDATRRIKEQPWGKGILVIALTGWGQATDREQSRNAGCQGHLVKPVELADLESVLKMAIAGAHRH